MVPDCILKRERSYIKCDDLIKVYIKARVG